MKVETLWLIVILGRTIIQHQPTKVTVDLVSNTISFMPWKAARHEITDSLVNLHSIGPGKLYSKHAMILTAR